MRSVALSAEKLTAGKRDSIYHATLCTFVTRMSHKAAFGIEIDLDVTGSEAD
jgi:hypothetical protein